MAREDRARLIGEMAQEIEREFEKEPHIDPDDLVIVAIANPDRYQVQIKLKGD